MTRDERDYKNRLAELGCMACRRLHPGLPSAPVELHHYRGGGWGKGDYLTLIPMCHEHHQGRTGIHGLGVKAFDRTYPFTQLDLLNDTRELMERDPR